MLSAKIELNENVCGCRRKWDSIHYLNFLTFIPPFSLLFIFVFMRNEKSEVINSGRNTKAIYCFITNSLSHVSLLGAVKKFGTVYSWKCLPNILLRNMSGYDVDIWPQLLMKPPINPRWHNSLTLELNTANKKCFSQTWKWENFACKRTRDEKREANKTE